VALTRRSVLKFDSKMQSWSEVAPMPEGRYLSAACTYKNDIYVFGGEGGSIPYRGGRAHGDGQPTDTTYRFSRAVSLFSF
jgi:hypothetical protein